MPPRDSRNRFNFPVPPTSPPEPRQAVKALHHGGTEGTEKNVEEPHPTVKERLRGERKRMPAPWDRHAPAWLVSVCCVVGRLAVAEAVGATCRIPHQPESRIRTGFLHGIIVICHFPKARPCLQYKQRKEKAQNKMRIDHHQKGSPHKIPYHL